MPRWPHDDVDCACETWAHQWVQNFGRDPDRAARYIGALGCTLGRVRELHDGAASASARDHQRFPEVFLGVGLIVNMAAHAMTLPNRRVLFAHYVARRYDPATWQRRPRPEKQSTIAAGLRVSLAEYHTRRDCAKACVRTVLELGRTENAQATRTGGPLLAAGPNPTPTAAALG